MNVLKFYISKLLLETFKKSPNAIATFELYSANSLVFDKIKIYGSLLY